MSIICDCKCARVTANIGVILQFPYAFGKSKMSIISIFFQLNDLDVYIVYIFKFPNKQIAKLNLKSFDKYSNESEHLLDYFINSVMDKYYVISNIYKNTTE